MYNFRKRNISILSENINGETKVIKAMFHSERTLQACLFVKIMPTTLILILNHYRKITNAMLMTLVGAAPATTSVDAYVPRCSY